MNVFATAGWSSLQLEITKFSQLMALLDTKVTAQQLHHLQVVSVDGPPQWAPSEVVDVAGIYMRMA
ncbi:uncharacterized protein N7496_005717 [Penicillium cataractarum]|uniref:Uncharacterized protein n=1 Tax=Penicillium cataractarum TaxID=2100454 RepID=A0A9W9VDN5_9EURO|nr:uncharacterized protein N7496_005717 [Penicillium cataractarum]KAJ5378308.1 hypothetical protein N7496_005717 [Penicillium cataractarum]